MNSGEDDAPSNSVSGSSSSNRPRMTKLTKLTKSSAMAQPAQPKSSKRLNATACEPCRKRKSKCDSDRPSCSACRTVYYTPCSYDKIAHDQAKRSTPTSSSKSGKARVQEIDTAAAVDDLVDIIAGLLERPEVDRVLVAQLDEVQKRLGGAAVHDSPQFQATPHTHDSTSLKVEHLQIVNSKLRASTNQSGSPVEGSPASRWFHYPLDEELITELFNLFFTVDNSFYNIVSPSHFLASYRDYDKQFCSEILVHAIVARAFSYYHARLMHTDPDDAIRAKSYGDAYHAEACRLMFLVIDPNLTACQALTIMAINEKSSGREEYGYRWQGVALRMAMEMNMHLPPNEALQKNDPIELQMRMRTFWAIYNIEVAFAVFMGKSSQINTRMIGISQPSYNQRQDSMVPQIRRGSSSDNKSDLQREILALQLSGHFCELSERGQEFNVNLYSPGSLFNMETLLQAYRAYQSWEVHLTPDCRLTGHQPVCVTMLHMYQKQLLINLFRPFQSYDLTPIQLSAGVICWQNSVQVIELWIHIRDSQNLDSVPACVVGPLRQVACIFLLQITAAQAKDYLAEVLAALDWIARCHPTAQRSIMLIWDLAVYLGLGSQVEALFMPYLNKPTPKPPLRAPSLAFFAFQAKIGEDVRPYDRPSSADAAHPQYVPIRPADPAGIQHADHHHPQAVSPLIHDLPWLQDWSHIAPAHDPYWWHGRQARDMGPYLTPDQIASAAAVGDSGWRGWKE